MMKTLVFRLGLLLAVILPANTAVPLRTAFGNPLLSDTKSGGQIVVGWAENVHLRLASGITNVPAKLDTGAQSGSVNAAGLRRFELDGALWVTFSLTSGQSGHVEITAPIKRFARIRRAGVDAVVRPVIELDICIADQRSTAEFTLADRSGMDFSVLVGRNFMAGRLLVDSGRSFTANKTCGDAAER